MIMNTELPEGTHSEQFGLFREEQSIAQRFEAWKQTPGGRQLLRFAYQEFAPFGARFLRSGQRVSMDYVMHMLRDRIGRIQHYLRTRRAVALPKEGGYRINDHFTAHIARHIVAHRPEWDGAVEFRKMGAKRMVAKRRITITEMEKVDG